MKTILKNGLPIADCRVSIDFRIHATRRNSSIENRKSKIENGFTLVEMLVVIAIIAILAAMLLPALSGAKRAAQKKQAMMEIGQIVGAIHQYDSVYGRFPVSPAAQNQAVLNAKAGLNPDFTYGGVFQLPDGMTTMSVGTFVTANGSILSNAEVMAILLDITNTTVTAVNANHQKNPQQTVFLTPKMTDWDPSQGGIPPAGVGKDLVYRDPWGNPYVISMDLNYDEQCRDAFYCSNAVSGPGAPGLNGLTSPNTTPLDDFQYHGKIMVWSAGPDGKIDPALLLSGQGSANSGVNKDNVISWQ